MGSHAEAGSDGALRLAKNEDMVIVETCHCNGRNGCNDKRVDGGKPKLSCIECGGNGTLEGKFIKS